MNTIKMFIFVMLFSVSFAQANDWRNDPPPNPGWVGCNGQWVRPNTCQQNNNDGNNGGYNNLQLQQQQFASQYNGGQQFSPQPRFIPSGGQSGQLFNANVNGQRMVCTWADRGASAVFDGFIANAGAYAINRVVGHTVIDRTGATVFGALAGLTVMCDPTMVDDTPSQQASFSQSPSGYNVTRSGGESHTRILPSNCNIEGVNLGLMSDDLCVYKAEEYHRNRAITRTINSSVKASLCKTGDGSRYYWGTKVECDQRGGVYTPPSSDEAVAPKSVSLAGNQTQETQTSWDTPTKDAQGHTCSYISNATGRVLADFLDASKNEFKKVATTLEECGSLRKQYAANHPELSYAKRD